MTSNVRCAGVRTDLSARHNCLSRSVSIPIAALACGLAATPAFAQQQVDFVVTPNRTETPIARAGSAITVITAEEIEKTSPRDVSDLLRRSPGLSTTQNGGAGSIQTVRLRGMDSRHTLVLVDGIRVSDPSTTGGEFDFSNVVLANVERIEILRGPQTALYGSDALGGVINIITKRGRGAPKFSGSLEGGSYGTRAGRAAVSGGTERLSYSFGITGYETAGFSRYGYRLRRLTSRFPQPFENDGAKRYGASGRVAFRITDDWQVEVGGNANWNRYDFDAAFGNFPDTPSRGETTLFNGYARVTGDTFDKRWRHSFTIFGAETKRESESWNYAGPAAAPRASRSDFGFRGAREGAEYQSDFRLGAFGTFIAGAKVERERFRGDSQTIFPVLGFRRIDDKQEQTTRSLFGLHQFSVAERLHLSLGGRIDAVDGVDTFRTWRGTLAYEIPETETKFRASVGTGGKAPSLYQSFSRLYGTRGLRSETSLGVDVGVDQTLFDGRLKLSATVFANRYRNFIDFAGGAFCRPDQVFGCYFNVGRAETTGFEGEARVELIREWLSMRVTYTHLQAKDVIRNVQLALRPENEARIGFTITPLRDLTIEPVVTFVGQRYSGVNETGKLRPYARLDVYADYKLNDRISLFARAENLTDARYQEVRDYGVAGRSFYGGMRANW